MQLIIEEQLASEKKDSSKLLEAEKLVKQIKDKNMVSVFNANLMQIWLKEDLEKAKNYLKDDVELKFSLVEDILKACKENQEIKECLLLKMECFANKQKNPLEKANYLLKLVQFCHQYLENNRTIESEKLLKVLKNSVQDLEEKDRILLLIDTADLSLQINQKNTGEVSKSIFAAKPL